MKRKKRVWLIIAAAVLSLALSSCAQAGTEISSSDESIDIASSERVESDAGSEAQSEYTSVELSIEPSSKAPEKPAGSSVLPVPEPSSQQPPPEPSSDNPPQNTPDGRKGDTYYVSYVQKTDLGWALRLANAANSLARDFVPPSLTNVGGNQRVDSRIADSLQQMIADCRSAGGTIWAQSCYRTWEQQTKLFQNETAGYLKQGYAQQKAESLAARAVARPGTSDHNLGLGIDFNNIAPSFAQTKAYAWLQEHAADYGFVMRYPEDKQAITQVKYEPWHYRYVGSEHAGAMKRLGFCLEEYVEYLENR